MQCVSARAQLLSTPRGCRTASLTSAYLVLCGVLLPHDPPSAACIRFLHPVRSKGSDPDLFIKSVMLDQRRARKRTHIVIPLYNASSNAVCRCGTSTAVRRCATRREAPRAAQWWSRWPRCGHIWRRSRGQLREGNTRAASRERRAVARAIRVGHNDLPEGGSAGGAPGWVRQLSCQGWGRNRNREAVGMTPQGLQIFVAAMRCEA